MSSSWKLKGKGDCVGWVAEAFKGGSHSVEYPGSAPCSGSEEDGLEVDAAALWCRCREAVEARSARVEYFILKACKEMTVNRQEEWFIARCFKGVIAIDHELNKLGNRNQFYKNLLPCRF